MPNWCENDLKMMGKNEDVVKVLEQIGCEKDKPCFDFSKVIPYPEKFLEMDKECLEIAKRNGKEHTIMVDEKHYTDYKKKYGQENEPYHKDGYNSGGYEWCSANWGTKWNVQEDVEIHGKTMTFNTPWAPPIPVIIALAKQHPDVSFSMDYFEQGAGYSGNITILSRKDFGPGYDFDKAISVQENNNYSGPRGG